MKKLRNYIELSDEEIKKLIAILRFSKDACPIESLPEKIEGDEVSIMKPNGYFIFSDNFIHGEEIRSAYQVSRPLSKIEKILVENGFEIVRRKPMFVLMNAPVDTTRQRAKRTWKALTTLLGKGETIGFMLGCILYPLEIMLVTISKETASTEIMTCRKIK